MGKKHRRALILARPAGVAISEISQVRGQQRIQAVVAEISLERHETNFLQHHVSPGIGQHFLFDPVPALHTGIGQFIGWHSRLDRQVAEGTMAFLFGEELTTVGDNQAEVAGAGLVDTGEIDFI